MFCLAPGNLADHGSRSLGALKADLEPLGSASSAAGRMWNVFIITVCSISTLFPSVNTEHGDFTREGLPKKQPQPGVTSKQAFHGNSARGWGPGSGVTPLVEALERLQRQGRMEKVLGFQQQGTEPRLQPWRTFLHNLNPSSKSH